MERSISSLTYKGTISDAITEAQKQKKLFVVYISGEDDDSISLERSTWVDLKVAESISKHCIFLHLMQGSVAATQFSAIYPQKTVPNISAIGYNGVMIWQQEGFISAESFVEHIGKAWAALQFQETAAVFLTAALASKKSESSSAVASYEKGSSSGSNNLSQPSQDSEAMLTDSGLVEQASGETVLEKDGELSGGTFSHHRDEQSSSLDKAGKNLLCPATKDIDISGLESTTCKDENDSSSPKDSLKVNQSQTTATAKSGFSQGNTKMNADEVKERTNNEKAEQWAECSDAINSAARSTGKAPLGCDSEISKGKSKIMANEVEQRAQNEMVEELTGALKVMKSNDAHLNIRLLNGTSLQAKFSLNDTLTLVKNYVDVNQVKGLGSYDLAVPYPRKLFNGEDMNKTLSELGFTNREALIVVPHRHATVFQTSQPLSCDSPNTGNDSDLNDSSGGYFGYAKRILSYMNPFSYLGGTASSSSYEPVPNDNAWQHRPNSGFQNNPSAPDASYHPYSPNDEQSPPTGDNASKSRKPTSSRFGGNIHTLRDAEGERQSDDRNLFWNGNSTQFGGDDKK